MDIAQIKRKEEDSHLIHSLYEIDLKCLFEFSGGGDGSGRHKVDTIIDLNELKSAMITYLHQLAGYFLQSGVYNLQQTLLF